MRLFAASAIAFGEEPAAIVAIVAFVLVAMAGAVLAVRMTARAIDQTAAVQAAEAPEIARLYIARFGSLAAAAPTIVQRVTRDGLRVTLFDAENHAWYGPHGSVHRAHDMHEPAGPPPSAAFFNGPLGDRAPVRRPNRRALRFRPVRVRWRAGFSPAAPTRAAR